MSSQDDAAAVRVFPPAVPFITILAGLALEHQLPLRFCFELAVPYRHWLGGLLIGAAVLGLGLPSVIIMRRTGQSENPWKPTTEIVEAGPFRFTRNPMYLQMVLVCLGASIVLWNAWILLLTPLCVWALERLAILPEEHYLERKFGEAYVAYKRRVPRWL